MKDLAVTYTAEEIKYFKETFNELAKYPDDVVKCIANDYIEMSTIYSDAVIGKALRKCYLNLLASMFDADGEGEIDVNKVKVEALELMSKIIGTLDVS